MGCSGGALGLAERRAWRDEGSFDPTLLIEPAAQGLMVGRDLWVILSLARQLWVPSAQ